MLCFWPLVILILCFWTPTTFSWSPANIFRFQIVILCFQTNDFSYLMKKRFYISPRNNFTMHIISLWCFMINFLYFIIFAMISDWKRNHMSLKFSKWVFKLGVKQRISGFTCQCLSNWAIVDNSDWLNLIRQPEHTQDTQPKKILVVCVHCVC